MTKEKAKQWIKDLISTMKLETSGFFPDAPYEDEVYEALEMGIKALEQESCEDAISRDKAIVQLSHLQSDWDDDWNVAIRKCIEAVKIVPPITPQPKTGHWEWVQYDSNPNIGNWHCSECNRIVCGAITAVNPVYAYKYCPECGARMAESEE